MKKRKSLMSKLIYRLNWVAICVLGTVLFFWFLATALPDKHIMTIVRAQDNGVQALKTIDRDRALSLNAVEIAGLTVGQERIRPGVAFQSDDSWLKNLTILMRNRTSKTIAFADLDVCFPETAAAGPIMCFPIRLGRIPVNVAYTSSGKPLKIDPNEKPLNFGRGNTMEVPLAKYSENIKAFLEERQPFSGITKCVIHFGVFFFDDGMQWMPGMYAAPDAESPGRYKPMPPSYFPGTLPARLGTGR